MKKKLIAIVLSVLLVVSAVLVLAACQKAVPTITFRNNSGRAYFTLETVDGKITEEMVNKAVKDNNVKNGDQFLEGWFSTVGQKDGVYTYDGPIDYNKSYTEDAEYYAKWHVSQGLPQGYTLIGVINGVEKWTPGEEPDDWKLVQDQNEKWLYSATISMKAGDQFKVKEKSNAWNDNVCNLGYEGVESITYSAAAQKVLTDNSLGGNYILQGNAESKTNVVVGSVVKAINLTVTYDYSTLKFRVVVNTLEVQLPTEIPQWKIVGTIDSWAETSTDAKVLFTTTTNKYVLTLTYKFAVGDTFKFKTNEKGWGSEINIGGFTYASELDSKGEAKLELPDDLFVKESDNSTNIKCNAACTVTLTLDVLLNTVVATVTALG